MARGQRGAKVTGFRLSAAVVAGLLLCLVGIAETYSAAPALAGSAVATARAGASVSTVEVDVVVYGTQTSGLAAVRELMLGAPHLRVALVSSGDYLETPLAQGLGAEDARDPHRVAGGFYKEWRRAVVRDYAGQDLSPFTAGGRLVYEPEA